MSDDVEVLVDGVWVCWDYGSDLIAVFRTEVEALRYALKHSRQVDLVRWGDPEETK